jgi:CheY-like chemotaxis protein
MRPLQVLVVDDCPELARNLAELLRRWGHHVLVAHDGARAMAAAEHVPLDAVLLDLDLPGMDGFAVAEALRNNAAHQAILLVAVTGHAEDECRQRAMAAGFNHYLTKPVSLTRLQRLLEPGAETVPG